MNVRSGYRKNPRVLGIPIFFAVSGLGSPRVFSGSRYYLYRESGLYSITHNNNNNKSNMQTKDSVAECEEDQSKANADEWCWDRGLYALTAKISRLELQQWKRDRAFPCKKGKQHCIRLECQRNDLTDRYSPPRIVDWIIGLGGVYDRLFINEEEKNERPPSVQCHQKKESVTYDFFLGTRDRNSLFKWYKNESTKVTTSLTGTLSVTIYTRKDDPVVNIYYPIGQLTISNLSELAEMFCCVKIHANAVQ